MRKRQTERVERASERESEKIADERRKAMIPTTPRGYSAPTEYGGPRLMALELCNEGNCKRGILRFGSFVSP